jgi:DNA-binding MarR family transcriptional regulator
MQPLKGRRSTKTGASRQPRGPHEERAANNTLNGPLSSLNFDIGRAYYNYIGVLERLQVEMALDKYLAPGMGHILFALFEDDGCMIKDLAARVRLAPSTLSSILNKMGRKGLLERRRDPNDGRAARIKLTPLGRSLEPRCRAVLERLRQTIQAGLSEEEVKSLKVLLTRVIENLRTPA